MTPSPDTTQIPRIRRPEVPMDSIDLDPAGAAGTVGNAGPADTTVMSAAELGDSVADLMPPHARGPMPMMPPSGLAARGDLGVVRQPTRCSTGSRSTCPAVRSPR